MLCVSSINQHLFEILLDFFFEKNLDLDTGRTFSNGL